MNKTTLSLPCPTCQKTVLMTSDYPNRPFCSKRCQLIDFGEWSSESHRIFGGQGHIDSEPENWSEQDDGFMHGE